MRIILIYWCKTNDARARGMAVNGRRVPRREPSEALKAKIAALPVHSGCYLFKNRLGEVIYVGKSKVLRNRVRSYFSEPKEGKLWHLAYDIDDIEHIETEHETAALLLECALIKEHRPKYNAQMNGEAKFLYIRIDMKTQYPGLAIVEQKEEDGAAYIGCFYTERDAERTLDLIGRVWHTPLCNRPTLERRERGCMNAQLRRCVAPCARAVSPADYRQRLEEIVGLFTRHSPEAIRRVQEVIGRAQGNMKMLAAKMAFEEAAEKKELAGSLERLLKKSKRLYTKLGQGKLYVLVRAFREEGLCIYHIEEGIARHYLRLNALHPLDLASIRAFALETTHGKATLADANLPGYLLEIAAEKVFLSAQEPYDAECVAEMLRCEICDLDCADLSEERCQ